MGKVVYDANGDCINNSGEQNLVYQSVALTQGTNTDIAFTDNSGIISQDAGKWVVVLYRSLYFANSLFL